MGFSFGMTSAKKLATCHRELQEIFNEAIRTSDVDFSIVEGRRSIAKQREYYRTGASQIDPENPKHRNKAKHLFDPSWAVDICIYNPGRTDLMYDPVHLAYVAGHIMSVAKRLKQEGKIKYTLRWGGNWDMDTVLVKDQRLVDMPHFELAMPGGD